MDCRLQQANHLSYALKKDLNQKYTPFVNIRTIGKSLPLFVGGGLSVYFLLSMEYNDPTKII